MLNQGKLFQFLIRDLLFLNNKLSTLNWFDYLFKVKTTGDFMRVSRCDTWSFGPLVFITIVQIYFLALVQIATNPFLIRRHLF